MARVLIVAKTRMKHPNICLGALDLESFTFLRLFTNNAKSFTEQDSFELGDVFEMRYAAKRYNVSPPHNEDVCVYSRTLIENLPLTEIANLLSLQNGIIKNDLKATFNGKLRHKSDGAFYIDREDIPTQSVDCWKIPVPLELNGSRYVLNPYPEYISLKFVGFQNKLPVIPAGTIVRLSLARWWLPPQQDANSGEDKKRCFLQLSGWFID